MGCACGPIERLDVPSKCVPFKEKFQSAYKVHHSTETALLRVYNDVMFNIDRGNGTLLVLLDLSAAFDTIDHQILFHILEHSLGFTDSALALMKSYLDGRQQCVQIEGVISEFAKYLKGQFWDR